MMHAVKLRCKCNGKQSFCACRCGSVHKHSVILKLESIFCVCSPQETQGHWKGKTGRDKLKGKKGSSKINGLFFNTRESEKGRGIKKIEASEKQGKLISTDTQQRQEYTLNKYQSSERLDEHRNVYDSSERISQQWSTATRRQMSLNQEWMTKIKRTWIFSRKILTSNICISIPRNVWICRQTA